MIALDSSVVISWLNDKPFTELGRLEAIIARNEGVLPPIVVTELLSGPAGDRDLFDRAKTLPVLSLVDGYWERAGLLRAGILRAGRRARLADTLIAQACIDANVPLLTRDGDFQVFTEIGGLVLA